MRKPVFHFQPAQKLGAKTTTRKRIETNEPDCWERAFSCALFLKDADFSHSNCTPNYCFVSRAAPTLLQLVPDCYRSNIPMPPVTIGLSQVLRCCALNLAGARTHS